MADADRMRDRLRELGRAAQRPLSPELEARVVERMTAFGPGVVRRSRWRQTALRVGAVALPLALCATWLGLRDVPGADQPTASDTRATDRAVSANPAARANAAEPSISTAPATQPVLAAAQPACAAHAGPETNFSALPGGRRWIDLGDRGQIVLEAGGDASLDASDPCKLALLLAAGRVNVHAADLFGGELKVNAGNTEVIVHGTTFAVERARERVTVDVDEGAVAVERKGRQPAPLVVAGQSLRITETQAPVLAAFSSESRQQLRAALSSVPVTRDAQPAASRPASASRSTSLSASGVAKLVARADKAWLQGQRKAARASYREAGEATGPTAEAAWLALARRELSVGDADAARAALNSYAARFPVGDLAAEATGIEFRAALLKHDLVRADQIARKLVDRYAATPQGAAAARWRREHGSSR